MFPSGRTDKGVHARMQVVGLRAPGGLAPQALRDALNARLPDSLGIAEVQLAPKGFHPQWSACGKEYRYRLQLAGAPSPEWAGLCWSPAEHPRLPATRIDPSRLAALLQRCEGTRDFFAFHASSSVRKPRTISRAVLLDRGQGLWEARIAGTGFARYQVRLLVGTCVAVAAGAIPEAQLEAALTSAEPIEGIRAPGDGLILWEVHYPPALDPFSQGRGEAAGVPPVPPFLP